jgi:uncharacterized membrane protein YgdD (TMEM256/DUF423 family)
MSRPWLTTGAALGALGVILGAFGAHLLRPWLPPREFASYETALNYLQVHALALLAAGLLIERWPARRALVWAARGFAAGCVFFSGSLAVLALTGWTWLGALVPVGGLLWIAGWVALALGCAQPEAARRTGRKALAPSRRRQGAGAASRTK